MNRISAAALAATLLLSACNQAGVPAATLPPSGVTASNGGGQRATGGLVDFGMTDGVASATPMSPSPRVPRF